MNHTTGILSSFLLALVMVLTDAGSMAMRAQDNPSESTRVDQLMWYIGKSGQRQPVNTIEDWLRRRSAIAERTASIMGRLPANDRRCELDMQVIEEVDCGSYLRRLISYASEPGCRVPAYLCIPKLRPKDPRKSTVRSFACTVPIMWSDTERWSG